MEEAVGKWKMQEEISLNVLLFRLMNYRTREREGAKINGEVVDIQQGA